MCRIIEVVVLSSVVLKRLDCITHRANFLSGEYDHSKGILGTHALIVSHVIKEFNI
jgi:hypothetical protein